MVDDEEVEQAARSATESMDLVSRLAEKVGATVRAQAVFGEAVERDGVTVIPVARARWGFGAGSGGDDSTGSGGGGGGFVAPAGYIEVRDDGAEFKPLRSPLVTPALALGVTVALAVGRAVGGRRR